MLTGKSPPEPTILALLVPSMNPLLRMISKDDIVLEPALQARTQLSATIKESVDPSGSSGGASRVASPPTPPVEIARGYESLPVIVFLPLMMTSLPSAALVMVNTTLLGGVHPVHASTQLRATSEPLVHTLRLL